jgi:hypothetical protein
VVLEEKVLYGKVVMMQPGTLSSLAAAARAERRLGSAAAIPTAAIPTYVVEVVVDGEAEQTRKWCCQGATC